MHLPIPVRELNADERGLLLAHTLALNADDRRLRFEHPLSDDAVRHYIEAIDLTRDVVFVTTNRKLDLIGAAHLARTGPDQAELGISVLERARGKGIGDARFRKIEGVADREPLVRDKPEDPRNRRISILLMR